MVDTTGRWLYVAQTFVPAAISRVEIADPTQVETWYTAPAADRRRVLDGLTRDAHDRLYVAANLGGEVWRVQEGGPGCVLAHLPPLGPSAVAFGSAEAGPAGARRGSAAATSTSSPSRATSSSSRTCAAAGASPGGLAPHHAEHTLRDAAA